MAKNDEYDRFAAALTEKFEDLTRWAIENWPNKEFPLLQSDFDASRREIATIVGPKLGDGNDNSTPGGPKDEGNDAPFVDMNPMPWP